MTFEQWYGNWKVVLVYVLLFAGFALGFARPRRRREWRGMGVFMAFLVALFTEMFGVPLTIYLLAPTLGLPPRAFGFYESHLWGYLLGRAGVLPIAAAAHLMMFISTLIILPGILLTIAGWRRIYREGDGLVTTGVYALMRHPQYLGIVLVATGFLVMWPTLPTLVMYPILLVMYRRLAGEEEVRLEREYGEGYDLYRERVPALLPVFRPAGGRPAAAQQKERATD